MSQWLAGSNDRDTGVLKLNDGTLLAKEYECTKYGVKRTWKILRLSEEKKGMDSDNE